MLQASEKIISSVLLLLVSSAISTAFAQSSVNIEFEEEYDLALIKDTVEISTPVPAQDSLVSYRITVMNQGGVSSGSFAVNDVIPAGMSFVSANPPATSAPAVGANGTVEWVVAAADQISPGEFAYFDIVLKIDDVMQQPFRNQSEITADSGDDEDSIPDDNSSTYDQFNDPGVTNDKDKGDADDSDFEVLSLLVEYDLALVKKQVSVSPSPAAVGSSVVYHISVMNQGTVNSGAYTVDEVIPPGLTFVSASPAPTTSPAVGAGGLVQWAMPVSNELAPSAQAIFEVTLKVADPDQSPYRNVAEITADSGGAYGGDQDSDPDDGSGNTDTFNDPTVLDDIDAGDEDDSDFEVLALDGTYDLALIKTLHPSQPQWLQKNSIVRYVITVKNQGNVASGSFTVTDNIPAGMNYVEASGPNFSCSNATPTATQVHCVFNPPGAAALAPGASANVNLKLRAVDLSLTPFRNWAEISEDSGDDIDSAPASNSAAQDTGSGPGGLGADPVVDHNDIDHAGDNANQNVDEDDSDPAVIGAGQTRPVTLQTFEAVDIDGSGTIRIDWSTSMEDANLGFQLYGRASGGDWFRLLPSMIPAVSAASTGASYRRTISNDQISEITITDVDLYGQEIPHGPFQIGQLYGTASSAIDDTMPPVDALEPVVVPDEVADRRVYLDTQKVGIHRVKYENLKNAGYDFIDVPVSMMALSHRGASVPAVVQGKNAPDDPYASNLFGPGGYIEFVATELDSIYTDSNRYMLSVDSALVSTISDDYDANVQGLDFVKDYIEFLRWQPDNAYSRSSPTDDPWYAMKILAFNRPAVKHVNFTVPARDYVKGRPGRLKLKFWTLSDDPRVNRDHSVVVRVNGVSVGRKVFEGIREIEIDRPVPANVIKPGKNRVEIVLPLNRGAKLDQIFVDSVELGYPKLLQAQAGRAFIKDGRAVAYQVGGLIDDDVSVYRVNGSRVARVSPRVFARGDRFDARFKGRTGKSDWYVASSRRMHSPTIKPVPMTDDLLSGSADYLVIAHPQFIKPELRRLVTQRGADGLTTRIVSTDSIYAAYSSGLYDPIAIKRYVARAKAVMGTQYVLLVGGDTYDYKNHLKLKRPARGWIPSLYADTGQAIRHAPVDPVYGDTDDDGIPDVMVGRFPVQSRVELTAMVNKTLQYPTASHNGTAVIASDKRDSATGTSFRAIGQRVARRLSGWSKKQISLQNLTKSQVRNRLIATINNGTAMTTYIGHSDTRLWSFDGILTRADVSNLQNHGNPTIVMQWGCWNTYYVEPRADAMAHEWLRLANKGAVAVMGAATLTDAGTEEELGRELFRLIAAGQTIGQAVQEAKLRLANNYSAQAVRELMKGFIILGDPALMPLK